MFDGEKRVDVPPEMRSIGMVFQSYALWPHMTVEANVRYPLKQRRVPAAEARRRVLDALAMVGLEAYAKRRATQLSGGQQQRVALARAIVAMPEVMLYDEPLSNLDPSLRRSIRDQIKHLHRLGGRTSVYVTHDLEEAMHLSDRIVVMQSGLLEQAATPRELSEAPATEFVARFVGFENLLDARIAAIGSGRCDVRVPGFGGVLGVPAPAFAVQHDDEVKLAVRGVNIVLSEDATVGVEGILREVNYLGVRTEYRVEVNGQSLTVVRGEGDARALHELSPGIRMGVTIVPDYCCIVTPSDLPLTTQAIRTSVEQESR
jgi:iron(III) transport system ATP-binding protein